MELPPRGYYVYWKYDDKNFIVCIQSGTHMYSIKDGNSEDFNNYSIPDQCYISRYHEYIDWANKLVEK